MPSVRVARPSGRWGRPWRRRRGRLARPRRPPPAYLVPVGAHGLGAGSGPGSSTTCSASPGWYPTAHGTTMADRWSAAPRDPGVGRSTTITAIAHRGNTVVTAGPDPEVPRQPRRPHAPVRRSPRSEWPAWWPVLVPLVIVLVGAWTYRWVDEDAFIDFRIIHNLLAGYGPVFNVGERVEVGLRPVVDVHPGRSARDDARGVPRVDLGGARPGVHGRRLPGRRPGRRPPRARATTRAPSCRSAC